MKYHRYRRLAALLLCLTLLLSPGLGTVEVFADSSETLSDLNDQYKDLQEQEKEIKQQLQAAQNKKNEQEAIKKQTTQQINVLQNQVSVLAQKINILEQNIVESEEKLADLDGQIAEQYGLFKTRLRAMYMSNNSSMVGLVLGTQNMGQFLARSESLKQVSLHDQLLIDNLTALMERVEEEKAALEADQADLSASKDQLSQKQSSLNASLAKTNATIQDIVAAEKAFLANVQQLQAQMKDVQAEIDNIYANMSGSSDFVGTGFKWPVPGYSYISSYFGWRWNGSDYHTGIDITGANVMGKPVVASNSGTVTFVKTTYQTGVGYGKYIIVDHGGGYSTLYAHLTAVDVSVGDYVTRGETIGKVGSTGWSTGAHLHFEVRIDGVAKNPTQYVSYS